MRCKHPSRFPGWTVLVSVLVLVAGCSVTAPASRPYTGLTVSFEPGRPAFNVQVRPSFDGRKRGLRVDVEVPQVALVYRAAGGPLTARVEWLVRLLDETGNHLIDEKNRNVRILRDDRSGPLLFRSDSWSVFFEVPPGRYRVEARLEDVNSGKSEVRDLIFVLPARDQPLIATELLLERKDGSAIINVQMPDTLQDLESVFYLTGNVSRPVRITSRILKLPVDTSAALPPYWNGPRENIRLFTDAPIDTLKSIVRTLRRGPLRRISFTLPDLSPGVFMAEVDIEDLRIEGRDPEVRLSRYIVVRPARYPQLVGYSDLISPLYYLAETDEWQALKQAETREEQRRLFDAFWGRFISNRTIASNTLRTFYTRAEEANLRYSGYLEGWKTDRGLIYMLLGEPLFIERSLDTETWFYSYDEGRSDRSFRFRRTLERGAPAMLERFILDRKFEFETSWRRTVTRWRHGEIG